MFCPQCGQQQAAEDVRFCSRCGFQLAAVNELLRSNGAAPERRFGRGAIDSPRRKGVRQGVLLMMIGIFLVPLFFMLSEMTGIKDETAMLGMLVFLGGFLRLIYAFFEDAAPPQLSGAGEGFYAPGALPRPDWRTGAELPPAQQSVDARFYVPSRQQETADISPRPSVVEGTTRRLGDERDPAR
jgi:hypothetical protein